MKERRKKILSLLLSSTLLLSAGCSKNKVKKYVDENNKVQYTGTINLKGVKNLYIVEICNVKNEKDLYLTSRGIDHIFDGFDYEYNDFGLKEELTDRFSDYKSDYGIVENIVPFAQFLPIYSNSEIKNIYTAEEIIEIFNLIKSNYDEIMNKGNVKKLELN